MPPPFYYSSVLFLTIDRLPSFSSPVRNLPRYQLLVGIRRMVEEKPELTIISLDQIKSNYS